MFKTSFDDIIPYIQQNHIILNEYNTRLMNIIVLIQSLNQNILLCKAALQHYHNCHEHRSRSGHSDQIVYDCCGKIIDGMAVDNNGKFYKPKKRTLKKSLSLEMLYQNDYDGNGLILGLDFVLDIDDPNIPIVFKTLCQNFRLPNFTISGRKTSQTQKIVRFSNDTGYPVILPRTQFCRVISWKQYLNTLNDDMIDYFEIKGML